MEMASTSVGGTELLGFATSLVIVIAAIVLLGWLYSRSKSLSGANSDVISVVASRALGTKERLLLIEVAGQQLLIGMTASQVQTLHVFDEPVVTRPEPTNVTGFAARFRAALLETKR